MYPVVTLEKLKSVILRNMGLGAVGTSLVDSDEHVRALFDLHRRYGTREVMKLLTEMQSMPEVVGGSSSSNGVIPCSPIHCPAPEVPMLMDDNSGEDSDEKFVPNIEESSDGSEFVSESQSQVNLSILARHRSRRPSCTSRAPCRVPMSPFNVSKINHTCV
ncbi:hypothetical protein PIB30_004162 [Stylosanthes scabra]|uniref:Uncharacterized protein n=1 Tax=Stylosanthes scabra TaxID=79078 RepID=A0ABU6Q3I7_9FABA|nr:hypothetical protein [Stylosanthes scabra]